MTGREVASLELHFEPDATAPRAVRTQVLNAYSAHPCLDTLLLCVSELVTNAVLHAGTPVSFVLTDDGRTIRVEVGDGSTLQPVRRSVERVSPTGRGIFLLDRLATRWGVIKVPDGKTVWFEIVTEPEDE